MTELINIPTPAYFTLPSYGEVIECDGAQYQVGNKIAAGSFGLVYECVDEWGNRLVAKILTPKGTDTEEIKKSWQHELNNLSHLRHPGITYIHKAFEYNNSFYLIVERCDETISHLINLPEIAGENWLPYVARDLLHALHFIHQQGFVHKDLHAGNVFISKSYEFMIPSKTPIWSFKIGDLGISRLQPDINQINTILAPWMLPPEYLNASEFGVLGHKLDIYHIGLLLLNLLYGKTLTFTTDEILNAKPRRMAEAIDSPYSLPLSMALRRHVANRTDNALDFWRSIYRASKSVTHSQV